MGATHSDPPARRINRGRGHSYEIGGQRVDGVTWAIDAIRKRGLETWFVTNTAAYAVNRWEELSNMGVAERLHALERSRYEPVRQAGARGSDVHELVMRLARGEEVEPSDELRDHVDAYLKFVDEWQPQEFLIETPVFNATLAYGGTLDMVATLADGWTWLIDWKTATKGVYREAALQLAAYRYAEFYLDGSGSAQPLPQIDFCGCVWLRADGYDFQPVEADEHAFRLFQYARQIARFLDDPSERYVGSSAAPPAREAA